MPHWSEKHVTYRFGGLCIVLGFVVYTVAFGIPTWETVITDGKTDEFTYGGLWQHKCQGLLNCQTHPVIVSETLFEAARAIACIALALYFLSVFLLIQHNCSAYGRKVQTENRIVSFLPFISGVCGGATCTLYVVDVTYTNSDSVAWGFTLGVIGSAFGMFGGILMLVGSCMIRQRVITETEFILNNSQFPVQTSSSTPMALVAVPVSFLTPQPNLPVTTPATSTASGSGTSAAQNYTIITPLQSSAQPAQPAQSPAPPAQSPAPPVQEGPRPDPSAPPPEFHDLYY